MDVYIKTRTTEKSTEDTAMQIEAEKSVSSEVIQDLIKAGIKEQTKKLQTQVNTLQNKIGPLAKNTRGANPARALSKKKNVAKDKKKKNNKKDKNKESGGKGNKKKEKGKSRGRSRSRQPNRKNDSADDESSASSDKSSGSKKQNKQKSKSPSNRRHG